MQKKSRLKSCIKYTGNVVGLLEKSEGILPTVLLGILLNRDRNDQRAPSDDAALLLAKELYCANLSFQ